MDEIIKNPVEFRSRVAEHIRTLLETVTQIDPLARDVAIVANNVEKGILNHTIREVFNKYTVTWNQPRFVYVYRARFRSLCANFEQNMELLQRVRNEHISANELSHMNHYDFNPNKWNEILHSIEVRKLYVNTAVATTSRYTCAKCNSRNISHESVQIRSLDEGASVFFNCIDCDYAWREM